MPRITADLQTPASGKPSPGSVRVVENETEPSSDLNQVRQASEVPAFIRKSEYIAFLDRVRDIYPELLTAVEMVLACKPAVGNFGITAELQIQHDLLFVAHAVSSADEGWKDKEVLVLCDVFSELAGGGDALFFCNLSHSELAKMRRYVTNLLGYFTTDEAKTHPGWEWSYDSPCGTMHMLQTHDDQYGSGYAEMFLELATQFAWLMAKADGMITSTEEEVVGYLDAWLRGP